MGFRARIRRSGRAVGEGGDGPRGRLEEELVVANEGHDLAVEIESGSPNIFRAMIAKGASVSRM
jgi:hypothetical protein